MSIDNSRSGFVPGRGTTIAIIVVWQLQEKCLAVNKQFYITFLDLEKAFDYVLRNVIRWLRSELAITAKL